MEKEQKQRRSSSPAHDDDDDQILLQPHGKKGIGMTLRDEGGKKPSYVVNLPKIQALNVSWFYTWGARLPDGIPSTNNDDGNGPRIIPVGGSSSSGIDFFPMLWGYYPAKAAEFERHIERMKQQHQRVVFGFNEPDSKKQSNIPIETAIDAWPLLQSLVDDADAHAHAHNKTILVSPSCVHPLGMWMESFMEQVDAKGLRVDAIGVHHYGGPNFEAFRDKMKKVHATYSNRPIIITEFAVADWQATSVETNRFSTDRVLDFMVRALEWMEQPEQHWIAGYAWFPFGINSPQGTSSALFDSNNELTPLGQFYSKYTTNKK